MAASMTGRERSKVPLARPSFDGRKDLHEFYSNVSEERELVLAAIYSTTTNQ